MYAPGGKCRIDLITVKFRDRDGTKYRLTGWCEDGEWHKRLSRRGHTVQCDDLRLVYKPSGAFWRAVVPRECLDGLANQVKVVRSRVGRDAPRPGHNRPNGEPGQDELPVSDQYRDDDQNEE